VVPLFLDEMTAPFISVILKQQIENMVNPTSLGIKQKDEPALVTHFSEKGRL